MAAPGACGPRRNVVSNIGTEFRAGFEWNSGGNGGERQEAVGGLLELVMAREGLIKWKETGRELTQWGETEAQREAFIILPCTLIYNRIYLPFRPLADLALAWFARLYCLRRFGYLHNTHALIINARDIFLSVKKQKNLQKILSRFSSVGLISVYEFIQWTNGYFH
jgi:hypothetical protein